MYYQRTSPTEKDRQIQSSLGDFQCLKQLIERDSSLLVGVNSSQIRSQPSFMAQTHNMPPSHQKAQPTLGPQLQTPSTLVRSSTKQVTSLNASVKRIDFKSY